MYNSYTFADELYSYKPNTPYFYVELTKLLETNFFINHKDIKVLDVGCGAGSVVQGLRKSGYQAMGLSKHYIPNKYGRDWNDIDTQYLIGDATCLDDIPALAGKKFDVITSFMTFMHIKDPAKAIIKLYEKLNMGGILCIDFFKFPGLTTTQHEQLAHQLVDEGYEICAVTTASPHKINYRQMINCFIIRKTTQPLKLSLPERNNIAKTQHGSEYYKSIATLKLLMIAYSGDIKTWVEQCFNRVPYKQRPEIILETLTQIAKVAKHDELIIIIEYLCKNKYDALDGIVPSKPNVIKAMSHLLLILRKNEEFKLINQFLRTYYNINFDKALLPDYVNYRRIADSANAKELLILQDLFGKNGKTKDIWCIDPEDYHSIIRYVSEYTFIT